MRKILLWVGLLPLILQADYTFQCVSTPNTGTTLTTYFTDQTPELTQVKTIKNASGKILSETTTKYISVSSICGIPGIFVTGCQTHVMTEGSDFNYSFRCDDAFGDLVFLKSSGEAYFRCQGETVGAQFNDVTFSNCK